MNSRDKRVGRIGIERYPLLMELIDKKKTAPEIAEILNVNQETVRKFARKRNIVIYSEPLSGEKHPCYRTGTTLDRRGYVLKRVALDSEHGYLIRAIAKRGKTGIDKSGYAPVHRIVMHDKLGRNLLPGEVVDHIDGDIKNNHPDNLRVFSSNAEHLKETLKGKCPKWTPEGLKRMRQPRNFQQLTDSL